MKQTNKIGIQCSHAFFKTRGGAPHKIIEYGNEDVPQRVSL